MSRKPRDNRIPPRDEREGQTIQGDTTPAASRHALPDGKMKNVDEDTERHIRHIFAKHGGAFPRLAE